MAVTYKSKVLAAVHEMAEGFHAIGTIDKRTMRDFDERCLTPLMDATPDAIRALREDEALSQAVLARHLNVTPGLVSQWERGEKRPSGPSLKLLTLIKTKGIEALI